MRWTLFNIFMLVSVEALAVPPILFQFDRWVGYGLEKLQTDGILESAYWHTRPKSRIEVAKWLGTALVEPSTDLNVQLYDKLLSAFDTERELLEQPSSGRFRVRGSIQLRKDKRSRYTAPALLMASYYLHSSGLTLYQEFEVANFIN